MIPKIIHYCWFGGNPLPKSAKKCIASWRKYCPDYEIIEWNESNFDVNMSTYTKFCHDNKKFAFLSDFVRLQVVYEHGGIYMDTDVEVIKSLDSLLDLEAFFGFENSSFIASGLGFGAEKGHKSLQLMMDMYDLSKTELRSCPGLNTKALIDYGLKLDGGRQNVIGAEIYPVEYFNPYNDNTGKLNVTENTYSIHWYSKSWISGTAKIRSLISKPFHRIFGEDCFSRLKKNK